MRVLLIIILCVVCVSSITCHKKSECEISTNVNQSEIVVTFKDKTTGKYLYSEVNPLYNKDSLKVLDQYGNSLSILSALDLIPNTGSRYYVLSFGNIYHEQTDASAFNTELCKTYIIKYSYNEFDTVQTCFKAKKTKCGSFFEILKVYNKGQLLANVQNDVAAQVTIIKN